MRERRSQGKLLPPTLERQTETENPSSLGTGGQEQKPTAGANICGNTLNCGGWLLEAQCGLAGGLSILRRPCEGSVQFHEVLTGKTREKSPLAPQRGRRKITIVKCTQSNLFSLTSLSSWETFCTRT